jgi:circadian clock protein KaiC
MPDEKRPGHFWEKEAKQLKEQIKEVKKEEKKPKITQRVPLGIDYFDTLVEGGVKKNSITLVEGDCGTGKSIFCTQFIVEGILKYNEPGIIINFEESREDFFENMMRFGWDLENLEAEKKLTYYKTTPEQLEKMLSAGGGVLRDTMDRIKAKRLVIDSLSSYILLHNDKAAQRDSCLLLFQTIKKWEVTTLVAGETFDAPEEHPLNILDFEVDGVIRLYNKKEQKARKRALEVFKMRGTKHSTTTFSFAITDKGVEIFPE